MRIITMARPERRNALTVAMVEAMAELITAAHDLPARAVIITGEGSVFCAGGDLPSLLAIASTSATAATEVIYRGFHGLVRAIRDCPVPVIAAVNGPALGAGLDLALCCDLRVASSAARFESTWVRVGLLPGMAGAPRLAAITGSTRAAEMLLLGQPVSAEQAAAWGLVNSVTEPADLLPACEEMVHRLGALPRTAVARTKASLRRYVDRGLDEELAVLGAQQGQLLATDEFSAVARRIQGKSNG
ncbi:MAG TPA: enoyl-CoA hydratase-related protein [Trebonia sp.]|jgi:2-(1,2-epoxy-1,2-dihydrophenyl)acetyl-CoA isomerase|nr:enoyl-CoA hydratase-related protein [Trebonia sp.]